MSRDHSRACAPEFAGKRTVRSGKSASRREKVAHEHHNRNRKCDTLVDAVINGERVKLYKPRKEPREKAIEIQIRVALAAAGVLVQKHHVDNRVGARTGLGVGVADLICCVPPHGTYLAIEIKRPSTRGDTSNAQKSYLARVERAGGVSGVATSVEEAMELVERARNLWRTR